jgi:hypothetical protein
MTMTPTETKMNWVDDYTDEELSVIYETICRDYSTQFLTLEENFYKIDK